MTKLSMKQLGEAVGAHGTVKGSHYCNLEVVAFSDVTNQKNKKK